MQTGGQFPAVAGLSLAEEIGAGFSLELLSEEACRMMLAGMVRPVMACPSCNVALDGDVCRKLYQGRDVICKCGRKHSLFSGTIFCGLQISAAGIVVACLMRGRGATYATISKATGVSVATISRLMDRLSQPRLVVAA